MCLDFHLLVTRSERRCDSLVTNVGSFLPPRRSLVKSPRYVAYAHGMDAPRVALFCDARYEANGIARTVASFEAYAKRNNLPLLAVHAGPVTRVIEEDRVVRVELRRWGPTAFRLEHDLSFDIAIWRYWRLIGR